MSTLLPIIRTLEMNIRSRGSGDGSGGGVYLTLRLKALFAFSLIVLPQLATSTVLDKLRDDRSRFITGKKLHDTIYIYIHIH